MDALNQLEAITSDLLAAYDITQPPVPVETMLREPRAGMWEELDLNQLSGTFLSLKSRYSPRMSMARMLGRHAAGSEWGKSRGLNELFKNNKENLAAFARMLLMPADLVLSVSAGVRNPTVLSMRFEVPEEDALARLQDLADRF